MIRYMMFKLFGWSSFTMRQMDEIRANWFCVGESFGINKTIKHLRNIGYVELADKLKREMEETNNENGIKTIDFETVRDYVRYGLDQE